jgi:hypothetical protein
MAHGGRTQRPPRFDAGLRVVGLLLVHLSLLHALFKLLLGLFVLFFGLLLGLLHLLQRQLFLLLSLFVVVIGGEATTADKVRWRLGILRANRTAGGCREVNGHVRQAN